MRAFLLFFCACLIFAGQAAASETTISGPEHKTELWQGKALGATFRVGICYQPNGYAKGVLLLRHRSGDEDVYHLYGTLKNGEFFLTHSSGHKLQGKLTGAESMEGKAQLSNGLKLSLSGSRRQDVPLAADDCAPLPGEGE